MDEDTGGKECKSALKEFDKAQDEMSKAEQEPFEPPQAVPNPEEWQDMLHTLESNLHAVETVQDEKMFNQTGPLGLS